MQIDVFTPLPHAFAWMTEQRPVATVLELRVGEADVGKVIGRQGRIARALRTIVRASGAHQNERVQLEIVNE